jgi:hypothetical protein
LLPVAPGKNAALVLLAEETSPLPHGGPFEEQERDWTKFVGGSEDAFESVRTEWSGQGNAIVAEPTGFGRFCVVQIGSTK